MSLDNIVNFYNAVFFFEDFMSYLLPFAIKVRE